MQTDRRNSEHAWLELLVILLAGALAAQLFPSITTGVSHIVLEALDLRHWSRATWFAVNAAIVLLLIVVRYRDVIVETYRMSRQKRAAKRVKTIQQKNHIEKQLSLAQQRELFRRLQEARKRQVY